MEMPLTEEVEMGRNLSKQPFLLASGKITLKNCLKDYFHIVKCRYFILQVLIRKFSLYYGILEFYDTTISYDDHPVQSEHTLRCYLKLMRDFGNLNSKVSRDWLKQRNK